MPGDWMEEPERIRMPREKEVLGIVEAMLGTNKISVRCQDNKIRIGRIPGRIKKRIWIREGDAILIKPWDIDSDRRGDVVWLYTPTQKNLLKKKNILTI